MLNASTNDFRQKYDSLCSALVDVFEEAASSVSKNVPFNPNVIITFGIESIPENLREFLTQKSHLVLGEIQDKEHPKKMHFYCKCLQVNDSQVTAKLIRNW